MVTRPLRSFLANRGYLTCPWQMENIEVSSSRCGLGHHPALLYAVADRLAQPEGRWQTFDPKSRARWLYPIRNANADAHHGEPPRAGSMPKPGVQNV